jgi:hypothetical protein
MGLNQKISSFSTKKGQDETTLVEIYQTFQRVLKLFQNLREERMFPNSLYEAHITWIPKPDKDIIRKLNDKPRPLMNINVKILKKMQIN